MTDDNGARAWSTYWSQCGTRCCLPAAPVQVTRALRQFWAATAAEFHEQATLLDLGCGAGSLSYLIAQLRPSAQLVGADFSQLPSSRSSRVKLHSGVRMEALPFADAVFDGAVSQFGIEYAEQPAAAAELARVTKSAAPVAFAVHHAGSPVLDHNRRRNDALGALTADEIATAFLQGDRDALTAALARVRSCYPGQDVVQEFTAGLSDAIGEHAGQRQEIWAVTCAKVTEERSILCALSGAAIADIDEWLADFQQWFDFDPPGVITGGRGENFAWAAKGRRL